jgi:hypothetical protein
MSIQLPLTPDVMHLCASYLTPPELRHLANHKPSDPSASGIFAQLKASYDSTATWKYFAESLLGRQNIDLTLSKQLVVKHYETLNTKALVHLDKSDADLPEKDPSVYAQDPFLKNAHIQALFIKGLVGDSHSKAVSSKTLRRREMALTVSVNEGSGSERDNLVSELSMMTDAELKSQMEEGLLAGPNGGRPYRRSLVDLDDPDVLQLVLHVASTPFPGALDKTGEYLLSSSFYGTDFPTITYFESTTYTVVHHELTTTSFCLDTQKNYSSLFFELCLELKRPNLYFDFGMGLSPSTLKTCFEFTIAHLKQSKAAPTTTDNVKRLDEYTKLIDLHFSTNPSWNSETSALFLEGPSLNTVSVLMNLLTQSQLPVYKRLEVLKRQLELR